MLSSSELKSGYYITFRQRRLFKSKRDIHLFSSLLLILKHKEVNISLRTVAPHREKNSLLKATYPFRKQITHLEFIQTVKGTVMCLHCVSIACTT